MTAKTATDILDTLIDQGKVKTYTESPRSIAVAVARPGTSPGVTSRGR